MPAVPAPIVAPCQLKLLAVFVVAVAFPPVPSVEAVSVRTAEPAVLAAGVPVIASPIGANTKIVKHGVNGFLASSVAEWTRALEALVGSAQLRAEMGRRGRESVAADYNLEHTGKRLAILLRRAAGVSGADPAPVLRDTLSSS